VGRILLVVRLALRDLRRRRTEAALLLIAILAATTTLTLGLVLRDAASDPYESTRAATKGPDVVAGTGPFADLADLKKLATASDVTEHSGPYPVIAGKLETSGRTSDVQVEGRDTATATVDQPDVTQGNWVSDGGVVLEAAFANSLDVHVGDSVTLGGKSFEIAPAIRVAVGSPLGGIKGFRDSHREARDAQRLLMRNPDGPRLTTYAEVEVVSLASQDEPRAAAFIAATLGDLLTADADLRETVRVYLWQDSSASRAATLLHTHRNTILKRIARAEALAPHPLAEHGLEVRLALELHRWLGPGSR
jgi:ABC-type lipoprotein release transport system permease subunit